GGGSSTGWKRRAIRELSRRQLKANPLSARLPTVQGKTLLPVCSFHLRHLLVENAADHQVLSRQATENGSKLDQRIGEKVGDQNVERFDNRSNRLVRQLDAIHLIELEILLGELNRSRIGVHPADPPGS